MKNKIAYWALGLALAAGLYTTRVTGIDTWTQTCLDRALETDTQVYYEDFDLGQFPIHVHYGKVEYSYFGGQITEKKPDTVPALSAFPTAQGPVLKVLPVKDFRTAFDEGDLSQKDLEDMYLSMVVHEGFHAYQMAHGMTMPIDALGQVDMTDPEVQKRQLFDNLLARLDEDKTYQNKWGWMMDGLVLWKEGGDPQAYLKAHADLNTYVQSRLNPDQFETFAYFVKERELIEGTARYMENACLEGLGAERNGDYDGTYQKGQGQFYASGCLKAEILADQGRLKGLTFDMALTLDDLLGMGG